MPPAPRPDRHVVTPRSGFTLIEVLVSLLLLSMLLAAAWGGIHTAVKSIHAGNQAIERMNHLRVSQQFLRRQISHILPLAFAEDQSTGEATRFEGGPHRMRFVAPMPGYLSQGGSYVQTLRLTNGRHGVQLTFSDYMLNGSFGEDPGSRDSEPMQLLDGIARGHFMYRGFDEQGLLGDWTDEWDKPDKLPVMVRVDFEMRPDSGLTWPEMDIPLMMSTASLPRGARRRMSRLRSQSRRQDLQQAQPAPRRQ